MYHTNPIIYTIFIYYIDFSFEDSSQYDSPLDALGYR